MTGGVPLRKGWCPGALRPMPAKDGLLLRLRITGATVTAGTLRAIAEMGRAHGNGHFDLTSRANLQMRGVSERNLPLVHEALSRLGLIDETASAEAVRNVLVSPLAGLESSIDVRACAAELEAALIRDEALFALPAKFGFVIDDGSRLSLASVPADIRFLLMRGDEFSIALGGSPQNSILIGSCTKADLAFFALRLAHAFLQLRVPLPEKPRRMRDLLHAIEPSTIATDAGLRGAQTPRPSRQTFGLPHSEGFDLGTPQPSPIGLMKIGDTRFCFGAGAPFGGLDAPMLIAAADAAESFGSGELRLTPWRALLFPDIDPRREGDLARCLGAHGYIANPYDMRLSVAACGGRAACEHATTETRADALSLMDVARKLQVGGIALHVSGCAKGCAHQVPAPYTLVGNKGRYDLVENGRAADACVARGLTLAQAREMLESCERSKDRVY